MHYIFFIPLCSIRHRAKIQTLSWNWHLRQLKRKYPGLSQLPPDYFLSLSVAVMLENFVSTLLDSPTAHWNSFLILWFINFVFGDSWYHSCPFIQAGTLVLTSLSLEIWAVNTRPGVNRSEHPHFLCVSGDKCLTAENICLLVLGLSPVFTVPVYSFSITSGNWSLAPGFPMKTCLKSLLCFWCLNLCQGSRKHPKPAFFWLAPWLTCPHTCQKWIFSTDMGNNGHSTEAYDCHPFGGKPKRQTRVSHIVKQGFVKVMGEST